MALLSLGRVLTVLTQEQADYIGVKIDVPFKGGHYRYYVQGSAEGVIACSVFDTYLPVQRWRKIAEVVDLGELFAYRARVRDDPGMRARSRRTI